jgi:hypothetical protein
MQEVCLLLPLSLLLLLLLLLLRQVHAITPQEFSTHVSTSCSIPERGAPLSACNLA